MGYLLILHPAAGQAAFTGQNCPYWYCSISGGQKQQAPRMRGVKIWSTFPSFLTKLYKYIIFV